jgi:pimeloyl-ACP methyl ester carboxylesterase
MTIDTTPFNHLYPFTNRFTQVNGMKMHYLDEGSGSPVVMLHGNPTWSFYFRNLVRGLSPCCRTIVPDHIGCGLSQKPGSGQYDYRLASRVADLEALLDQLDIRKSITLIVHDWGGMIGTAFAVRHPERIQPAGDYQHSGLSQAGRQALPMRLRMIRRCLPLAVPAVLGLNLFAVAALYMAPRKPLPAAVKRGLDRSLQSLEKPHRHPQVRPGHPPVPPEDPSYALVEQTARGLHRLATPAHADSVGPARFCL